MTRDEILCIIPFESTTTYADGTPFTQWQFRDDNGTLYVIEQEHDGEKVLYEVNSHQYREVCFGEELDEWLNERRLMLEMPKLRMSW